MQMLSDRDIARRREVGDLGITPWAPGNLGPCSYDLTLSHLYRRPQPGIEGLDLAHLEAGHTVLCESDGPITVMPLSPILCSTVEFVQLGPAVAARVEGRSSLGRLWLMVHSTAGFIDPGFCGNLTLEVVNLSPWPIEIHPGQRIAQLAFFMVSSRVVRSYAQTGSYQNQEGPTESRFKL